MSSESGVAVFVFRLFVTPKSQGHTTPLGMAPRPYHFDSIDQSIRRKLDELLTSLLESNPVIGNTMDRRLDMTVKCGEHIVELFHQSLVQAHTVSLLQSKSGAACQRQSTQT
jgi:hypothetical protein